MCYVIPLRSILYCNRSLILDIKLYGNCAQSATIPCQYCVFNCFNHGSYIGMFCWYSVLYIKGGVTVQLTGGYESKYALPICFLFTIFSTGASIPIPYTDNFWLVSVLIWIQLFCGGASVPPLTGRPIINSQES